MPKETCENCKYFKSTGERVPDYLIVGQCRERSPQVHEVDEYVEGHMGGTVKTGNKQTSTSWPCIPSDEWCGKWRAK